MASFDLGFIVGALFAGVPAGIMATLTIQWWRDQRTVWRRVELDDYTARLRALDRPKPVRSDDEYLMAQLRKANREGLL